jgi:hypothetical protein
VLVFIDESGDPGFKIAKGSSSTFVLAMVIFADHKEAELTQREIRGLLGTVHHRREFKFNKCRPDVRDAFFESVRSREFVVRSIVVQKALIWSERLRKDDETFYRFFCKSMVRFDNQSLKGAKLIVDGSGNRQFRRNLVTYLRAHSSDGSIADIKVRDSVSEPLLQLADMCVGAIARSYRTDRETPSRWRQMLGKKLEDVWEFK